MTRVSFGVGFAPIVPAPDVIHAAQLAERLGYDVFWITDSHLAGREAMAMLGALAVSTEHIHLGPGVSHLAGRHPSVIASAMATLHELAPGRIRLGIGVGDSGPLNLGVPRTSLHELETTVTAIHELLEGREIDGSMRKLSLGYVREPHRVPIYIAGSAERTQRLAGRVADGALISGMPHELRSAIEFVRAGERERGRLQGSTRILLWTTVAIGADRAAARAAVRASVARRALNSFGRLAHQGKLEAEDAAALERLQAAHDTGHLWEPDYADLVPERWIDLFAIAGTPEEVRGRLQDAIEVGADEISLILMGPRPGDRGGPEQLATFAEAVMKPLQRIAI
ncbi:MAG: LLM class flavin-dependent oxidoreductase [Chloroflexi bacterium]|nr:LLM class flavin-dependent oxidoreductase [Chloroflexota bacterium]